MAYVEVEAPQQEVRGDFVRLSAIGDKLEGYFISSAPASGAFAGKDNYTFLTAEKRLVTWTPGHDGQKKMKVAIEKGNIKPGVKCLVTYTGDLDTGKENKMPVFKVQYDNAGPNPKALEAAKAVKPAPKPAPTPEADPFADDIPF